MVPFFLVPGVLWPSSNPSSTPFFESALDCGSQAVWLTWSFEMSVAGLRPPTKLGAPGSSKAQLDRTANGKSDKATDSGSMATDERAAGIMGMDPLGIAGMPMTLGSQPMGDMGPGATGAGEGDGDKASPSKVWNAFLCCGRPGRISNYTRLVGRGTLGGCIQAVRVNERRILTRFIHRFAIPLSGFFVCDRLLVPFCQIPEELLKPSYLLLEPVRYTLAEILRLCRRPMVLPGPLVRCMLQDLLGAVAICHDRDVVIKSLDAEKVGCTFAATKTRASCIFTQPLCVVRSHTCFEAACEVLLCFKQLRCRFAQLLVHRQDGFVLAFVNSVSVYHLRLV